MAEFDYPVAEVSRDINGLTFNTDGVYPCGDPSWKNNTSTAIFKYNIGTIGLMPRVYETNAYMSYKVFNSTYQDNDSNNITVAYATVDVQMTNTLIPLSKVQLPDTLTVGELYTLKVSIIGSNYRFYLNDVLIFNLEYSSLSRGSIGAYASATNILQSIEVTSSVPDGWTSNVAVIPEAIVDVQEMENDDVYLYMSNPTEGLLTISQILTIESGAHTLSLDYIGSGAVHLIEQDGGAQTYTFSLDQAGDWTSKIYTYTPSVGCTSIMLQFEVQQSLLKLNNIQNEPQNFASSYIYNASLTENATRAGSSITFPSKDSIDALKGTLTLWVKPNVDNENATLFSYDKMKLTYSNGDLIWSVNGYQVSTATSLSTDTWYFITTLWSGNGISLGINDVFTSINQNITNDSADKLIYIGTGPDEGDITFNGTLDEVIIYSLPLSNDNLSLLYQATDAPQTTQTMMLRATFNYAIGNFNKDLIEVTMTPKYGSPVLIEKQDGSAMQKVSFFDPMTGEYRTYNIERIPYDGYSDYVEVTYDDLDTQNFKPVVQDETGALYGDPYTYNIVGNKIYFYPTDAEKKYLKHLTLFVSYQLNDAYTVDFNIGTPDSFRVNLGKHDGQPVNLYYEGNRFQEEKLVTMVEMNPTLNPNHQGFLYITNNVEQVTNFKSKATPNMIPANGTFQSLIVIEPVDHLGNFVSQARLKVTTEQGTILPAIDTNSLILRDRSGRFLYRYTAPLLYEKDLGQVVVSNKISILDEESGLGSQLIIYLKTLSNTNYIIEDGDTIETIALDFATSTSDVAMANNKTLQEMTNYIPQNTGKAIQVPINYSAAMLQKSDSTLKYESMAAVILEEITNNLRSRSTDLLDGLGPLIDLNNDGLVDERDIDFVQANRTSDDLYTWYTALMSWKVAHNEN